MDANRLEKQARRELDRRIKAGETLATVAAGASVTATWLAAWRSGRFKTNGPGVYVLERLVNYLRSDR